MNVQNKCGTQVNSLSSIFSLQYLKCLGITHLLEMGDLKLNKNLKNQIMSILKHLKENEWH